MRWRQKIEVPPKSGDLRTRTKFAWLPTDVQNGEVVWLEKYCIEERWYSAGDWIEPSILAFYSGWRTVRIFAQ